MTHSPGAERLFRIGRGNWEAFDSPINSVFAAAENWRRVLGDIEKPWLCWSVADDWSIVQQRLVAGAGWTPVVGYDPRVGPPPAIADAVVFDFNQDLGLPVLYPHFILEFVFAFAEKLAFWHSDLLLTEADMESFGAMFAGIEQDEMAAVVSPSGWQRWLPSRKRRYWELLGCTTRGASQSQFDHGCGWWMHFYCHPNAPPTKNQRFHWEYGCGVHHWKSTFGGRIHDIPEQRISYGHFTRIGQKSYKAAAENNVFRNLSRDIRSNYDLKDCTESLNLSHLLSVP
ncbi:MAG: hypothetical protein ACR2Q4_19210 [Geminicoccaceae bacterium]